ncbi:MAG: hypothetical protein Q9165_008769 [Trypethelium subeluteriae]
MSEALQPVLNKAFDDDDKDKGYILKISTYIEHGADIDYEFSRHAMGYKGRVDLSKIVKEEVSAEIQDIKPIDLERSPQKQISEDIATEIQNESPRTLIMVSAINQIRDDLRKLTCKYFDDNVRLLELEYQSDT